MSDSVPRAVLDATDISEIAQLVLRERSGRDLGLWEQMRACFHEDSRVRLSWIDAPGPEFVERSKEMAERNVRASHRLGPVLVTLAGERAIAILAAIIDIPLQLHGVDAVLSSHARFVYRAERRAGLWRLRTFDVIYHRDELVAAIPGQSIAVDPEAIKAYRASYRLLAYCLGSQGFPVGDTLAGDDRPDLVAALTKEVYGWAGLEPPT